MTIDAAVVLAQLCEEGFEREKEREATIVSLRERVKTLRAERDEARRGNRYAELERIALDQLDFAKKQLKQIASFQPKDGISEGVKEWNRAGWYACGIAQDALDELASPIWRVKFD